MLKQKKKEFFHRRFLKGNAKKRRVLHALIFITMLLIMAAASLCEIGDLEQILFHISRPVSGVDPFYVYKFTAAIIFGGTGLFFAMIFVMGVIYRLIRKPKKHFSWYHVFSLKDKIYIRILSMGLAFSVLFFIVYMFMPLGIAGYIKKLNAPFSGYYEENYKAPEKTLIRLPEKNNLIVIHLESMERAYFNREIFGDNLAPNLERMANSNISFKGYRQVKGTGWTIGGLFSLYCGVPLKAALPGSGKRNKNDFFTNIKSLPNILKEHGYRTYYMQGADLRFSGKNRFLEQHGFDVMYGREDLQSRNDYIEDFDGDWGVNDHALFEYVKKKLTEIAEEKKPFFMAFLTVDTHGPDGFLNDKCEEKFDDKFKNVLACSDELLNDFIIWLEKQSFYKDTVIVILGDHLAMHNTLYDRLEQAENREIVNVIINSRKNTGNLKRVFTMFDLMPTLIESMGGEIEGRRLGLGVSLFSEKKTLIEKEGFKAFNENIYAKSLMYEEFR
ncbi:MAG: LTA synthase family protein [bacterium]